MPWGGAPVKFHSPVGRRRGNGRRIQPLINFGTPCIGRLDLGICCKPGCCLPKSYLPALVAIPDESSKFYVYNRACIVTSFHYSQVKDSSGDKFCIPMFQPTLIAISHVIQYPTCSDVESAASLVSNLNWPETQPWADWYSSLSDSTALPSV